MAQTTAIGELLAGDSESIQTIIGKENEIPQNTYLHNITPVAKHNPPVELLIGQPPNLDLHKLGQMPWKKSQALMQKWRVALTIKPDIIHQGSHSNDWYVCENDEIFQFAWDFCFHPPWIATTYAEWQGSWVIPVAFRLLPRPPSMQIALHIPSLRIFQGQSPSQ